MIKGGPEDEQAKNFTGQVPANRNNWDAPPLDSLLKKLNVSKEGMSQQASNITNIINNNNNINNFIISDAPPQKAILSSTQPIKIALNRSSATPETLTKSGPSNFSSEQVQHLNGEKIIKAGKTK